MDLARKEAEVHGVERFDPRELDRDARHLHDRRTGGGMHVPVRVRDPLRQPGAPLSVDRPRPQPSNQGRIIELVEVATEGQVAAVQADGVLAGVERVEQRGRRQLGGPDRSFGRREARLDLSGNGDLRHHQQDGRAHRSTRAKSRAARADPRTLPETFDRVPVARGR